MPTEPIRPEDHSIDGNEHGLQNQAMWDSGGRVSLHDRALIEAIHQTFERDALNVAHIDAQLERQERELREWAEAGAVGEMPNGDLHTIADPDTEIDRHARLIVDGEYRCRAEANPTRESEDV